jgi:arylsulfatase A-like enzyme
MTDPSSPPFVAKPLRPLSLLILSGWCGLVSGWLEVATVIVRKRLFDSNHLYQISSDFVWMIPAINLLIFVALGALGCLLLLAWPGHGRWVALRVICGLTLLPIALIAFPQVYATAWLLLSLGIAARLTSVLERHPAQFARLVRTTFPLLAVFVPILAGGEAFGEWLNERREARRPLPPPGLPNILLIVMDTVAADHLSLHGYNRPTCPTLVELSRRGIRFNAAQAASSWTLPSHASMFTGRWPHELSAGWRTALDAAHPTLAEYLGSRGYATAGFIANNFYCARDSGLGRGFTRYRDYIFPELSPFKLSVLVSRSLEGVKSFGEFLRDQLGFTWPRTFSIAMTDRFNHDRKDAAVVNREFLEWLAARAQPERPFFAFLNYFDAHYPYQLPPRRIHRFGTAPADARETRLIADWWLMDKTGLSSQEKGFVVDAYDDCVAAVDEQLGRLFDELGKRGTLEQTWVIVTSDHGESFGEHPGVFCHGASLYQTELHVPLVVLPPVSKALQHAVDETVSLRDLAATIVDLAGDGGSASPFGGESLVRFWDQSSPAVHEVSGQAIAEVVPNEILDPDRGRSQKPGWPLGALADRDWTYIRREEDGREELFRSRVDAYQRNNLAAEPSERARVELMRANLRKLTAGPLTPERFSP